MKMPKKSTCETTRNNRRGEDEDERDADQRVQYPAAAPDGGDHALRAAERRMLPQIVPMGDAAYRANHNVIQGEYDMLIITVDRYSDTLT